MRPRIGLIFRYGPQHDNNTKFLMGLSDSEKLKGIGVVQIDWRYKLSEEEKKEVIFKYADPQYKKFCKNEYIKKELNRFYAGKIGFTEIKDVDKEVTPDMIDDYNRALSADLLATAESIYTYSTDKTLAQAVDDYLDSVDGIYIPGFSVDLDQKYCIDTPSKFAQDGRREIFERALVKKAIERGIPVLGICAGSWLLATCFEGVKTNVLGQEEIKLHNQGGIIRVDGSDLQAIRLPVHRALIKSDSMLGGIVKNAEEWAVDESDSSRKKIKHKGKVKSKEKESPLAAAEPSLDVEKKDLSMGVNSTHWRVVVAQDGNKIDSDGLLIISAVDPEFKTIEAFESKLGVPVMGVQFHPEYRIPVLITTTKITPDLEYPANRRILQAFAETSMTHLNKQELNKQVKLKSYSSLFKGKDFKQKEKDPSMELGLPENMKEKMAFDLNRLKDFLYDKKIVNADMKALSIESPDFLEKLVALKEQIIPKMNEADKSAALVRFDALITEANKVVEENKRAFRC